MTSEKNRRFYRRGCVNGIDVRETDEFLLEVTIKGNSILLDDPQIGELIKQLTEVRESAKWKRNMWIKGIDWVAVASATIPGSSLSPEFGKPFVEKD